MTTFTPPYLPNYGATRVKDYRDLENDFGDGYIQDIPDGLNTITETWQVAWTNISEANANDIEDQLDALAGTIFQWQTPKGVTKSFICKQVTIAYTGFQSYNVSANFVQRFT